MRPLDYLRLGMAGLKAHKRQTLTVTLLVGLLFGILTATALILSGLEQTIFTAMLEPTQGQVLLQSSVDLSVCGENCDVNANLEQIRDNVKKYGGEVVDFTQPSGFMGTYYQLADNIFAAQPSSQNLSDTVSDAASSAASNAESSATNNTESDAQTPNVPQDANNTPQILVPLATAASLVGYTLPETGASITDRLQAAQAVADKTVGQTITTALGQQYYIVDLLPSGDLAGNLAFANLGQSNPLDLILTQVYTGSSLNFILPTPATTDTSTADTTSTITTVFAKFADLASANAYYHDPTNFCDPISLASLSCSTAYRFTTQSAISDPLGTYGVFQNTWEVFQVVTAVIIVIAVVIAVATYSRIIGKDQKIIRLYFALSANSGQVRGIYLVYLLGLSLLALIFAGLLGVGLAVALSLAWQDSLLQLFALGLNVQFEQIWLLGLHPTLGWAAIALLVTPLLTILIEHRQLRA